MNTMDTPRCPSKRKATPIEVRTRQKSQAVRGKCLPENPILKTNICISKKLEAKIENAGRAGSQHCHFRGFKDAKTSWMRIVTKQAQSEICERSRTFLPKSRQCLLDRIEDTQAW